jgi:hypothetical protein
MAPKQKSPRKRPVVAAFKLVSKDGGSYIDPAALDLATFMNECVTALLSSAAERQCTAWWTAMRERRDEIGAHRLH